MLRTGLAGGAPSPAQWPPTQGFGGTGGRSSSPLRRPALGNSPHPRLSAVSPPLTGGRVGGGVAPNSYGTENQERQNIATVSGFTVVELRGIEPLTSSLRNRGNWFPIRPQLSEPWQRQQWERFRNLQSMTGQVCSGWSALTAEELVENAAAIGPEH